MRAAILAALLLAAGTALGQSFPARLPASIGGESFVLPLPQAYVQVPPGEHALTMLGQNITPPGNRLLGYFISESDLAAFLRQREAQFERYFLVQTLRSVEHASMSQADFANVRRFLGTQQAELFKKLEPNIADLYRDMERNLSRDVGMDVKMKVGDILPLGVYEDVDRHISFGIMSRIEARAAGRSMARDVICVTSVVLARGKTVFFYAYATRNGPQDLAWAKEVSRAWVAEFLRLNP